MVFLAIFGPGCSHNKGSEGIAQKEDADTAKLELTENEVVTSPDKKTEETPKKEETPSNETKPKESPENPSTNLSSETALYATKHGDTLMKIAFQIYGDISRWKDLFEWNKDKLRKASRLTAGTEIKYQKPEAEVVIEKNGDSYLIKKGDTLGSIAFDLYAKKSKWKKLYENNKQLIKDPNVIYAGFYLYYQITEQERLAAQKSHEGKTTKTRSQASDGPAQESVPPPPKSVEIPKNEGLNNLIEPQKN